jgi:F420H(2)-dependent quinone reductase
MSAPSRASMRRQWKLHKLAWNLSGGRLGRKVIGMPVLELETTGAKSGQPRRILITYVLDDGKPAIIGTNAGATYDPAWVKNLRADAKCRIRRDGRWRHGVAHFLDGTDHQCVWAAAVAVNKGYADYRETVNRPIPIVRFDEQ